MILPANINYTYLEPMPIVNIGICPSPTDSYGSKNLNLLFAYGVDTVLDSSPALSHLIKMTDLLRPLNCGKVIFEYLPLAIATKTSFFYTTALCKQACFNSLFY